MQRDLEWDRLCRVSLLQVRAAAANLRYLRITETKSFEKPMCNSQLCWMAAMKPHPLSCA